MIREATWQKGFLLMSNEAANRFLAHSRNDAGHDELLRDHLSLVADRASRCANDSGFEREAYIAGLLHDIGKYGDLFRRIITGYYGIDARNVSEEVMGNVCLPS
jgi:HD superfamily phosphohydrolase YqeK